MRIFLWLTGVLLLIISLGIAYLAMLVSGIFGMNFAIEDHNFLHRQVEQRLGVELELSSPIRIHISDSFIVRAENVVIPSVASAQGQNLLELEGLVMEGRLGLDVLFGNLPLIDDLSIQKLAVDITRDASGQMLLPDQLIASNVEHFLPQPDQTNDFSLVQSAFGQENMLTNFPLRKAQIKQASIVIHDPAKDNLISLRDLSLFMPGEIREGIIEGQGQLNGADLKIDVGLTPRGSVNGLLSFAGINLNLNGVFFPLIQLDIDSTMTNVQPLADFLGTALPEGPFAMEAKVTEERRGVFDIKIVKLVSSNSDLQGTLKLSVAGRAVIADLRGEVFVLSDFLPQTPQGAEVAQAAANQAVNDGRVIPNIPLPAVLLRGQLLPEFSDIRANIKLKKVDIDGFILDDLLMTLRLEDISAGLEIKEMGIGLGGIVDANISLDVRDDPKVDGSLNIQNVPISTFQRYIPEISKLDGLINGDMRLQTEGRTLREVAANLNGAVNLGMYSGYVHLPDNAISLLNTISPSILDKGILIVECSNVHTNFKQGKTEGLGMYLKSRALHAYGDGKIDLGEEVLDTLLMSEFSVLGDQLGLPLKITQTLADPKFSPDLKGLLRGDVERLPVLSGDRSDTCYQAVEASITQKYDGLPGGFNLQLLQGALNGHGNVQKELGTIQQKVQDVLQGGLKEKVGETLQSLGGTHASGDTDSRNALEDAAKSLLNNVGNGTVEGGTNLEEAGKSLLKGLLN